MFQGGGVNFFVGISISLQVPLYSPYDLQEKEFVENKKNLMFRATTREPPGNFGYKQITVPPCHLHCEPATTHVFTRNNISNESITQPKTKRSSIERSAYAIYSWIYLQEKLDIPIGSEQLPRASGELLM